MKKKAPLIILEAILLIGLIILGLLQLGDIDLFWKMNFESLINIFITASLGIIGFYISIIIIENNTSKRKKIDFLEMQISLLIGLLDSNIIKLKLSNNGEYPEKEDFLSCTQKIRDIIANLGRFIELVDGKDNQYKNLLDNYDKYNQISDEYNQEKIKENHKRLNQRREDMINNANNILVSILNSY